MQKPIQCLLVIAISFASGLSFGSEDTSLPKEICTELDIQPCGIKNVDALSSVDLNKDGIKEIIFAHGGGSCGEQHYIFTYKNKKWVQIGNWCGMDGGGYQVLSSKHHNYLDIDTGIGVIRFNGKEYPDTTSKN